MKMKILALAVAAGTLALPAQAGQTTSTQSVLVADLGGGSYSFSQSGFDGGASMTGSFTGFDTDGNFILDAFQGELSSFSASFSGNSLVNAWSTNLGFLVFELNGSNSLGDDLMGNEGIVALDVVNAFEWAAGSGPFQICDGSQACGIVTGSGGIVPEPASWMMLIAGFGLTGAALRRRRPAMA